MAENEWTIDPMRLVRYAAGHAPLSTPLRIGDQVTVVNRVDPPWDGTVVDVLLGDIVRVYWRYPLGKVKDHHPGGLVRVT